MEMGNGLLIHNSHYILLHQTVDTLELIFCQALNNVRKKKKKKIYFIYKIIGKVKLSSKV